MAIATRTPLFIHTLLLAGAISLVACGGSSGGGKPKTPDTTPNPITFSASTNADVNAVVESAPVTISGIDAAAPVTITGGEYSINGGVFTSAAGTISNGQTLRIRITASDNTNTPKEATVTVGGVSARFTVTTAPDVTPDVFSFTAKTEAAVGTEYTSDAITVKGIDIAVPVTITGGSYSINGGEFTSAAGTVSADQTITVKTTSGNATETSNAVVLTIGGVSGTFTVTTVTDTTPPVAEFKFPTPYTMSEANTVTVRGTATDDHAITNVKLVVGSAEINATPKSEINGVKDFSSWTATIPLTANAENEIKVIATDDRKNTIPVDTANKVVVRQRVDYSGVFPDSGSPVKTTSTLLLDSSKNRLLYATHQDGNKIFQIDIPSGKSSVFADFEEQELKTFGMGAIDQDNKNAYFPILGTNSQIIIRINLDNAGDYSAHGNEVYRGNHRAVTFNNELDVPRLISVRPGGMVSTRLDNWEASITSDASLGIPNSAVPLGWISDVVFDKKYNRYLLSGTDDDVVYSINASNGERGIFSSESVGAGDAYGSGVDDLIVSLTLDAPRNRLIVLEMGTGNIFAVDLDTAERSIISQMTLPHPTSDVWPDNEKNYIGSQIDVEDELLYTVHHRVNALMVVDLQSGQQLILSKTAN